MLLLNVLVVLALFLAALSPSVVGSNELACKGDDDCTVWNWDYCYEGKCRMDPDDYYVPF